MLWMNLGSLRLGVHFKRRLGNAAMRKARSGGWRRCGGVNRKAGRWMESKNGDYDVKCYWQMACDVRERFKKYLCMCSRTREVANKKISMSSRMR